MHGERHDELSPAGGRIGGERNVTVVRTSNLAGQAESQSVPATGARRIDAEETSKQLGAGGSRNSASGVSDRQDRVPILLLQSAFHCTLGMVVAHGILQEIEQHAAEVSGVTFEDDAGRYVQLERNLARRGE